MKRVTVLILIVALAVSMCVAAYMLSRDEELEVYVAVPPGVESADIVLAPEGIVSVESGELAGADTGKIVFRKEAAGEAEATLVWNGLEDGSAYSGEIVFPVKATESGILIDELTGNFTGWISAFIGAVVFFTAVSAILFAAFLREMKSNMFSYLTVRYLGFSFFFLLIGMIRLPQIISAAAHPGSATVWSMLVGLSVSTQNFVRYTAPLVVLFAVAMTVSNVSLLRHEGFRPANLLGIGISVLMVGGAAFGIMLMYSTWTFDLRNAVANIYSGVFCYFECLLFASMACGVISARHTPGYDKDYVVVLGCRIREDGTLYPIVRGRVDRAIGFVRDQYEKTGKQAVLVPSGGKGSDEMLAEAAAMAEYMRLQGIPDRYILAEDSSETTRQNMQYSKALIERTASETPEDGRIAFSTSDFHVFRSGILAREQGWRIDGMGCRTKWYFWPNAFIREFIAMLADSIGQQIVMLVIICTVSWSLTLLLA